MTTRHLRDTAVYWANPQPDGYGGFTYGEPVEIACRWEQRQELFVSAQGREEVSRAVVYVGQDLALGGVLMLGELADLASDAAPPDSEDGVFRVQSVEKVSSLDGTLTMRKAWL